MRLTTPIAALALLLPAALRAQQCAKPRVLFAFDTSGSMAWESCDLGSFPTDVDSTVECPGVDVPCNVCGAEGCGNGLADDSRLYKVKQTTTAVVEAFASQVQFALARFHQTPAPFSCKTGGWQGAPAACVLAPLGSDYNAADIIVDFSDDATDLLAWVDFTDNVDGTADPSADCALCPDCADGCDKELRPSGATPLGGSLYSVRQHLDASRAADPAAARPYAVVLLTDGENNCPDPSNSDNDPTPEQAAATCAAGVPVHVIGFSAPGLNDMLDLIAASGCGPACRDPDGDGVDNCDGQAILVDSEAGLTAALSAIVGASLAETCNGVDDDCDGETDEDPLATPSGPCGLDTGECLPGQTCCVAGVPDCCDEIGPAAETCDCLDNDCDGVTDEDVCPGGDCRTCARCAPHTQGYWHRQCAGCGGIDSGGGSGPGEHPDFSCDELASLFARTDPDLSWFGQDTCAALDADPPSDPCERALKQYAASLLNVAAEYVSADCPLSTDAGTELPADLLAEVAARIASGDCGGAVELADAFNNGALCPASTSADGGHAGDPPADAGSDTLSGSAGRSDAAAPANGLAEGSEDGSAEGAACSCGIGRRADTREHGGVSVLFVLLGLLAALRPRLSRA